MIRARDDLAVEYAALLLALGEAAEAEQFLNEHQFQPWEGGEGAVLRVWERTHLTLARRALAAGDATLARTHLDNAWHLPIHLGEDRHPLANTAELFVVDGDIRRLAGDEAGAETAYRTAAAQEGDFIGMAVAAASTRSYASSWRCDGSGTRMRPGGQRRRSWRRPRNKPRLRPRSTTSPPRCRTCCCSTRTWLRAIGSPAP